MRANTGRPARWPTTTAGTSAASAPACGTQSRPLNASAIRPRIAKPMNVTVSVSRVCTGEAPRASAYSTTGGPEVLVDVVSAPDAKPAAGAAQRGGAPGSAARRRARARTASVAKTPSVTPICSAVVPSAFSSSTPANTPGTPHASITSDSRTSGCGRRPSVPSVIRFTTSPSRISSPTACAGALTSAKPKPVADCSAAPASTATPAAISRAPTTPRRLITCHPCGQRPEGGGTDMAWDFSTEPEFQEKLDWMREFVREEIWPIETVFEELGQEGFERAIAPLKEQVKERGLWAAHLPPDLGGQGFGQVKLGLMHEILGTTPFAPPVFGNAAPDSGNSEILAMAGTEDQKDQYLYPLLNGDLRSAFSMTEPETAGSDPTLLQTRAELDGDEWVINGHKWFSSNASVADFLIVMAVTDPEAQAYQRASMLIVPADTPGVTIVRDIPTMEHPYEHYGRIGGHSEILYEDVRVPKDALLGPRGAGFLIAQQRLGPGRIHHCMRWLGVSRRAFDMLCERAQSRYSHGSLLADKQTVQNWIADSAAEMDAARLMTLHAAWKMDTQGAAAARREIALIKFYGARVLHDVVDRALQAHGSLGYSTDLPLVAMYRFARAARIYDGPDEVHRQSVARQILRGVTAPEDGVPTEHVPTRREEARRKFADLLETVTSND